MVMSMGGATSGCAVSGVEVGKVKWLFWTVIGCDIQ